MENKHVGFLVIGISFVMMLIVFIFNFALKGIVSETCTHGPACSMYDTIKTQTWLSFAITTVIFIVGLIILLSKPKEKIIIKTIKEKRNKLNLSKLNLDEQEKRVIEFLQNENGTMFQASLMEKLGIGKVGVTRLLDKLEAKQIVERKRRGMNNVVVLRD
jgi:magnesium-transporting ATPase (P-type)